MTSSDTPQSWHHGLVARWWAEFNRGGPEIAYFASHIDRLGGPTLDVACGAGRLLIPFVKGGRDVDGCDISADMLAYCRQYAVAEGLRVNLYHHATHELKLPRRYRTIVMCGGFGIGGVLAHDQEALRRLYHHLEPGGTLLLDYYLPYLSATEWSFWRAERQPELPLPWPAAGDRKVTADGAELELLVRLAALDPLEQVLTRDIRARLWRAGAIVAEEEHTLKERQYLRNQVVDMLQSAGFSTIAVTEGYTDAEPTPSSGILVFHATR